MRVLIRFLAAVLFLVSVSCVDLLTTQATVAEQKKQEAENAQEQKQQLEEQIKDIEKQLKEQQEKNQQAVEDY